MASAILTSKGQITIPVEMRESLNLHAGHRIDFIRNLETGRYEVRPAKRPARSLIGMLPKPEQPATIAEMNAAINRRGAPAD